MSTAREDYIRVKRKNQTFFLRTAPSDTFAHLKSEISLAMGGDDVVSPQQMRLYVATPVPASDEKKNDDEKKPGGTACPTELMPDAAILSDHGVKNDAVVYAAFSKSWESGNEVPDGDDEWEEIDVV